MVVRRPSDERGRANHGWLDSRHTFSFADYHDLCYVLEGELAHKDSMGTGSLIKPQDADLYAVSSGREKRRTSICDRGVTRACKSPAAMSR